MLRQPFIKPYFYVEAYSIRPNHFPVQSKQLLVAAILLWEIPFNVWSVTWLKGHHHVMGDELAKNHQHVCDARVRWCEVVMVVFELLSMDGSAAVVEVVVELQANPPRAG